jgi:leucyl-tRNA---protein transferase
MAPAVKVRYAPSMRIPSFLLPETTTECAYFPGRAATTESFISQAMTEGDLESLLACGYRHFGAYFYRPICRLCHQCVPLRIPLSGFSFSRSGKRALIRGAKFVTVLERPQPSNEAFELYQNHKQRFKDDYAERDLQSGFQAFFHSFPFSFQLSIRDGSRLVGVSHLDVTKNALSAIYCYYDDSYTRESIGTFAINKAIEIGRERGASFLYLGYYVAENRHMSYKGRFHPSQILLEEGQWVDYRDSKGKGVENNRGIEFFPKTPLQGDIRP